MTLIGILDFEKGTKLEYSDPNWNSWGWKALIGISPLKKVYVAVTSGHISHGCLAGAQWAALGGVGRCAVRVRHA